MEREDRPDHTEEPGGRDVGAGYPEEQQGGANPGVEREQEGGEGGSDAPEAAREEDGGPGQATGNPGAAG